MRAAWSALSASLHLSLSRLSAERHFRAMQRNCPELAAHRSIAELLLRQRSVEGDPEARFRVIRLLVTAAQSGAPHGPTAHAMVIVALWPGLDAAYHRLWRSFPMSRADLASDLLAEVSAGIGGMDLAKVRSVAATLIRNAERDLRRALVNQDRLGRITDVITGPQVEMSATLAIEADRERGDDLEDRLACLSRRDALLLKRVLILGETQSQAGQALGLGPDAARKRFARALSALRRWKKSSPPVPFRPGGWPLTDAEAEAEAEAEEGSPQWMTKPKTSPACRASIAPGTWNR